MSALFDRFPVGSRVAYRLSPRSAPIACMIIGHVPAGEVENAAGETRAHGDLLSLAPDDGGGEVFVSDADAKRLEV